MEKLARPKRPKGSSRLGGQLLDRGKMHDPPFTAVSRVAPEFVQILATLEEPAVEKLKLARAWSGVIEGVSEARAIRLVNQMAEFARQAIEAGVPVLELDLM